MTPHHNWTAGLDHILASRRVNRPLAALLLLAVCSTQAAQAELSWAEKMFEKPKAPIKGASTNLSHDFGVVARGSDVRYRFRIRNLYRDSVHIANVRTTCGCSAAKPTKTTLASREEAFIEVTMNTNRFVRRKDSNLIVTFDAPLSAEVRIPITAYIRTDIVLSPGSVNFGSIDAVRGAQQVLKVEYAGREDWIIKEVRTSNPNITATAVEKGRGGGRVSYELTVRAMPGVPVGSLTDRLTIVTDDAKSPFVPLLVQGRVEADITVTPGVVALGAVMAGKTTTKNVVLRGKKPFAIAGVVAEGDPNAVEVRLTPASRPIHVLPLRITPPSRTGDFDENVKVTITGRDDPVIFRIYGRVVE